MARRTPRGHVPLVPEKIPAVAPGAASPSSARVMAAFQETMQAFLEVQRTTMLAYLSGRQLEPTTLPANPLEKKAAPPRPAPVEVSAVQSPASADLPRGGWDRRPASRRSRPQRLLPAGRDEISRKLLDIVRERTGYPLEVLRLDLDLEAELGIDSIKRVEILGKLRDAFPQLGSAADPEAMDRLVNARTLAAIVDRVERAIGLASAAAKPVEPAPEPAPPVPVASNGSRNGKHRGGTQRLLLKTVEAPLPGAECGLMSGGTVLITEDDGGVAEAVARAIQARGWQTVMIGGRNSRLDWTSPDAVDRAIRQARRGTVRGTGPSVAASSGPDDRTRRNALGRPHENPGHAGFSCWRNDWGPTSSTRPIRAVLA